MRQSVSPLYVLLAVLCTGPCVIAAPPPAETVVAKVNLGSVTRGEVDNMLRQALRGRSVGADALPGLQAQMLAQLIDRRIVEEFLHRENFNVEIKQIDEALEQMKAEIKTKGLTWEQYLAQTGMSEEALRGEMSWKRIWETYTQRQVTAKILEDYFAKHRREFDGTKLRVRHVLLRPARAGDGAAQELFAHATDVRKRIAAGELTFAAAAEKYSSGPSRSSGGDLGLIPRHGRMAEEFSKAAFALEKNELSQPVITTFGVHLLQWTEEEPGKQTVADVAEPVRAAVIQQLFEALAAKERPKAKVEFTGAFPYFKLGTRELVNP